LRCKSRPFQKKGLIEILAPKGSDQALDKRARAGHEGAVALVIRRRMAAKRFRQSDVARWSGLSRSFVQHVLRAGSCPSLFMLLELSAAVRVEDDLELLSEVIAQRDEFRAMLSARAKALSDPTRNDA
jgi:hypothetical protein